MNLFDKVVSYFSPERGAKRALARVQQKFMVDDGGSGSSGTYGTAYGPYTGARSNRTSTPWFFSPKNPALRYASAVALRSMRDRARTIEKNNEIAEALLSRTVENVVGPKGFQLQVTSSNPAWTPEQNSEWSKKAEALMAAWFPTADISGLGWIEHQQTVVRSVLRDGDLLVILDKDGFLQGVEGDLVADPSTKERPANTNILFGVELDSYNNPKAFWVQTLASDNKESKTLRIDAKDAVFVANKQRFGQIRGVTIFATIFDLLDQISAWKLATLMAARIAACFGVAITKGDKSGIFNAANQTTNSMGQTQAQMSIEPGMIQYLEKGESIETINPSQPGHNFPANLTAMVRLAGLPFGMPLELVLLDFSKSSYTASRASMLQAYRKFQSWQQKFISGYLRRVYQWRISKFIKAGLLEPNPDAWNHKWIAQPWPFLDPIKEIQAAQMAMDCNLDTLKDTLQAHGKEIDAHIQQRGKEIKELAAAGIPALYSQALMQYVNPTSAMQDPAAPPGPSPVDDEPDDEDEEEDDDLEDAEND